MPKTRLNGYGICVFGAETITAAKWAQIALRKFTFHWRHNLECVDRQSHFVDKTQTRRET